MELERDGAVQYTDTLTLDEDGNIQTQTRSGDTGESVTTYNGSGDLLSVVATDGKRRGHKRTDLYLRQRRQPVERGVEHTGHAAGDHLHL